MLEAVLGNLSGGGEYARWQRGTTLTFRWLQQGSVHLRRAPSLPAGPWGERSVGGDAWTCIQYPLWEERDRAVEA